MHTRTSHFAPQSLLTLTVLSKQRLISSLHSQSVAMSIVGAFFLCEVGAELI
jgi:hypothetical protein